MKRILVAGLMTTALLATGCAAGPGHTRAAGTVGGTALGAVIGGASGGSCGAAAGAIIGLMAGSLAGEGIAQDQERCGCAPRCGPPPCGPCGHPYGPNYGPNYGPPPPHESHPQPTGHPVADHVQATPGVTYYAELPPPPPEGQAVYYDPRIQRYWYGPR